MSNFPPPTPNFEKPEGLRLKPRELRIPDDERESLSRHTGKMLEAIFPSYNHNETIESITPIKLNQAANQAPNDEYRALLRRDYGRVTSYDTVPYNRVRIKAEVKHLNNREYLVGANLVLSLHNQPGLAEIVLTADETKEEAINLGHPQYYLQFSDDRLGASEEILPLDAQAVSSLLSGILEQADPSQIGIHTPRENMLAMVGAIASTSDNISVKRHGCYEITHKQAIGHSIVNISDHHTYAQNGDVNRVGSTVELIITQPFYEEDEEVSVEEEVSAETELHFSSYLDEINTTLGLSYNKNQSGGVNLSETLKKTLNDYNNSEISHPSLFSTKLLQSLEILLLIEQPEGTTIERTD